MNKPVVNTGVQISVSVFVFSQKESDMTERLHFTSPRIGGPHGNSFFFSYGNSTFSFLRNPNGFPHWLHHFVFLLAMTE